MDTKQVAQRSSLEALQRVKKVKKEATILPAPKMRSNMDTKQVAQRSSLEALQRRSPKREKSDKKLSRSIKKIRADMVEISEGQKRVREGQMEVRKRFQEISKEAAKRKEETSQISKQSAANQLRLDLMFQFGKARAENDWMLQEQMMLFLCSCFRS
ncbi:hypothetical protein POPTR_015G135100v4 [Populus trichocarpa]|uniref:Uncharacterized protein n=1 Tax=Populus trichocarpa TaxID=3694 RepID=B9ID02_POPTR|nr:hypothetical protein POPTR_015G135100v4 [Populus trichocarpa]|eukprot:XP_002321871.2 uncharacterized protein LOC7454463 [Populus trichocarpa]